MFKLFSYDLRCRDCRLFLAIFLEFLSDELQVSSYEIVSQYHQLRYGFMLCNYEVLKIENGYVSNSESPLKPKSNFIPLDEKKWLLLNNFNYVGYVQL